MAIRYRYTDKAAIKRAIRHYPHAQGMIERERLDIIQGRSGVKNGSGLPDPTFGAVNALSSSRRIQRLEAERAAVEYMLQTIRRRSYWRDIYAVLKSVLWDGLMVEEAADGVGVSAPTAKRYLRFCYLLVGAHMGLIEKVDTYDPT